MPRGSFSVDDEAIESLRRSIERAASTIESCTPRLRSGAIDGMQTAWGDLGEQTRVQYLEGAESFLDAVRAVASSLRDVAQTLDDQQERTRQAEEANRAVFDGIFDRLDRR